MKKGDVVRLDGGPEGPISGEVGFTFACPFCGLHVAGTREGRVLFHALPFCDSFGRMTVEEFVHECCVCFGLTEGGDA